MARHGVELTMARRQIDAMIKADPTEVILRRREKEDTGDGGWRWASSETLLPIQEVCLIPFKRRLTEFLTNTEVGNVADLPYVLLGRYDLDIQKDDRFTVSGEEFQVISLDISEPEVKVTAHVDYFGGGVNG